ncbi:MAG: DUF975 family protein [Marinilabiliaceae bacterium]|nr:DUF975 family protein [Marinilabiliaceae bacterium]
MKTRSELKDLAIASLKGKWGDAAVVTLIYMLICFALGIVNAFIPLLGYLIMILVLLVIGWGYQVIFLGLSRGGNASVGDLFEGFSNGQFGRIIGTMALMFLYVILWCLLLYIPGIIKALSYSMTPFILRDTDLSYNEAIERSMKLMDGHKWQLFVLELSFLGWGILCMFTFGIGLLWLEPYMVTTYAEFYKNLLEEEKNSVQTA